MKAENCGHACAISHDCTHFVWTYEKADDVGTCWLKQGVVSRHNAKFSHDRDMLCGFVTNSESPNKIKHGIPKKTNKTQYIERKHIFSDIYVKILVLFVLFMLVVLGLWVLCYLSRDTKAVHETASIMIDSAKSRITTHSVSDGLFAKDEEANLLLCKSNVLNIKDNIEVSAVDFKSFQKEDCIGKGGFGTVYKCFVPPYFHRKYAVKHLPPVFNEQVRIK